jgi:hypothetical protein
LCHCGFVLTSIDRVLAVGASHKNARIASIDAGLKKPFRRLPCGFPQDLSTENSAFPQVFFGFSRFSSEIGRFSPVFA